MHTAAIALGGALGTAARIACLALAPQPVALMAIDVAGAFLLGLWWGRVEAGRAPANFTPLIATGALGSFTTFSALTKTMIDLGWWVAAAYGAAGVAFGLLAAAAGYASGRGR